MNTYDVELGDQAKDVENETDPGSPNTKLRGEWKVIGGTSGTSPGGTESDVSKADGAPGQEVGETRKSQKPVEDLASLWCKVDIGEETEEKDEDECNVWATLFVNLSTP